MIDIRKLKELVRLMVENELSELDLQDQQETVTIKRGGSPVLGAPIVHHAPAAAPISAAPVSSDSDDPKAEVEVKDTQGLIPIVSPMVGTVYLAPNPESPAYVASGASTSPFPCRVPTPMPHWPSQRACARRCASIRRFAPTMLMPISPRSRRLA